MDSDAWDERYRSAPLLWSAGPNRWVEEVVRDMDPGTALDVGAGEGRNSIWLASKGWQVTAVDFSAVALNKGKEIAAVDPSTAERIDWLLQDVTAFVPESSSFDLVLIAYLHLTAPQRRTVIAHSVAALREGGVFVVVGHDTSNIAEGTGGPQDPEILYSPEDLRSDLPTGVPIVVRRAEKVPRPVEGESVPAIDALFVASRSRSHE